MSLFRLDASLRAEGSVSRAIADIVEEEWRAGDPDAVVVRRHVGVDPIAATTWGDAVAASIVPADLHTPDQAAASALAATLVDEMVGADALLFATPLYNFGVSQHFKAWADVVIADPRMRPFSGLLAGKPAVLVTVRGGNYLPGTPRHGWDHSTDWARRILEEVWQLDLKVVEREFTFVGVKPELDRFRDMAAELQRDAEQAAHEHGRFLAAAVRTPA